MAVRELPAEETHLAYRAMLELRPDLGSLEEFVATVNAIQRPEGYRLVAAFESADEEAIAAAGFRVGHNLAWGHFLYVDDLITAPSARKRGRATELMRWLMKEAGRLGCDQLHLDSGTHRHDAHRFYLVNGLSITSFHFGTDIG